MSQPHILGFKMSENAFLFFAIHHLCKLMSDVPDHVLKIKYDVMELPAAAYTMIKSICFSTSYMLYIFLLSCH